VAVLAAMGLLLAACGDSDDDAEEAEAETSDETSDTGDAEDETDDTTPADGPVTLNFWSWTMNDTQKVAIEAIIEGFQAENPNITIDFEERDIDAHKDALRTSAGTEAAPDMYTMWTGLGLGGEFVEAGLSADLTDIYEEFGWNDRFVAPALSSVGQYDGIHGVPWSQRGEVVFYRTDLFEQAGITDEPTSYEELIEVNEQLVAAGITPIQFGGSVNWHLMRLLDVLLETTCGPETHDALMALEANWADEACATEAFEELSTWSTSYLNEGFIGIDNDESSQLLYAGLAAMALEGDWFNGMLDTNSDLGLYGMFPFPTGAGRLYGFTEAVYIGSGSPHQQEAALFMDYLTSDEVQTEYYQEFGSVSVNKAITPDSEEPLDQEWVEVFAESEGLYLNGDQALSLENTTEFWRIQNAVAIGEIAAADAASEFQAFIDNNG
jgi:raffinose/stachyose/melibiose transport system substrate-binding protein